ncbi:MAG TPA: OFA family MFS transporter [Polyangiaceae bacterium]|jgi:MFS family permease|nr:OFA family MFS transporter [Polyangiaceae bacterium]
MNAKKGWFSFLDRENTVAGPDYRRALVPPAALSIHLAIGQAYSLSVFNLPMSRLIGVTKSSPEDWPLTTTVWIFNVAFAVLGVSAALFGKWLERVGPRRAMFVAALCFSGGFLVAAAGIAAHWIALVILGYGVFGGIGLGLGYISPVSTLIKWFPDRPGMATGLAIMGFGGGAMIGAPLAQALMDHLRTAQSAGVAETFVSMGLIYFVFMMFGVVTVRVPAPGWKPASFVPPTRSRALVSDAPVTADEALHTPQFWLLWAMLFLNVTAGIGILSQASPMIQEMFPGRINAALAAAFVGLLSLFNLAGRFFWASLSDPLGRKRTYMVYFVLGALLYVLLPATGRQGSVPLFVACAAIILSMYGGGFATIPAYLRDMFGVPQVGAIHGRILTAWSAAALVGPTLVTYVRKAQLNHGVPSAEAYSVSMYIMAALLALGFVCDIAVRSVDPRHYAKAEAIDRPKTAAAAS